MRWLAVFLIALEPVLAGAAPALSPSPDLTPRDVVEAQLHALKNNDDPEPDAGIRVAFGFASPANQLATGPLDRFRRMLKNPAYAPMLNHRAASVGETTRHENLARIKATLLAADGETVAYVWILSLQEKPPCERCWMTDIVMRVDAGTTAPIAALAEQPR